MNEKAKVKVAYADAIIDRLRVEGLLTVKESTEVKSRCHEILLADKC